MSRLPGAYTVCANISIAEAITRFLEKHGTLPELVAVNVGYRITDGEALAMRENDVQLVQLASLHDLWVGPVPLSI